MEGTQLFYPNLVNYLPTVAQGSHGRGDWTLSDPKGPRVNIKRADFDCSRKELSKF